MPAQAPSTTTSTMTGNVSQDYMFYGGTMVPTGGQWSPQGVPIGYAGYQQQQEQAASQAEAQARYDAQRNAQINEELKPYEQKVSEAEAALRARQQYWQSYGYVSPELMQEQVADIRTYQRNLGIQRTALSNMREALTTGAESVQIPQVPEYAISAQHIYAPESPIKPADILFAQAHGLTVPTPSKPYSPESQAYMQQVGVKAYTTGAAADVLIGMKAPKELNVFANIGKPGGIPYVVSATVSPDNLSGFGDTLRGMYYDLAKTEGPVGISPGYEPESMHLRLTGPGGFTYEEEVPWSRLNETGANISNALSRFSQLSADMIQTEVAGVKMTVPVAGAPTVSGGAVLQIPSMLKSQLSARADFLSYFETTPSALSNLQSQAFKLNVPTTSVGRGTSTNAELFDLYVGQPARDTALRAKISQNQYEAYRYFQTDTAFGAPMSFVTDVNAALSAERRLFSTIPFPWKLGSAGVAAYQTGFNLIVGMPISGVSAGIIVAGEGEKFLTSPRVFTEDIIAGAQRVQPELARAIQLDPMGMIGTAASMAGSFIVIGETMHFAQAKLQAKQAAEFESTYKERFGQITPVRNKDFYSVQEAIMTEKNQYTVRASAKFEPIFSYYRTSNMPIIDTGVDYVLRPSSVVIGGPTPAPFGAPPSRFVMLPETYSPRDIQIQVGLTSKVSGSVTTPTFFGLGRQTTWTEGIGEARRAWPMDVTPEGVTLVTTPEGMISFPAPGRETIFEMANRLTQAQYAQPFRSVTLGGNQYSFFTRGEEYAWTSGGGEMLTIPGKTHQQFIGSGKNYNLLYELRGTLPKISSEPTSLGYSVPSTITKTSMNVFDKGGATIAENQISRLLKQLPQPQPDVLKNAAISSGIEKMVTSSITKETGNYLLAATFVPLGVYQSSPAGYVFAPFGARATTGAEAELTGPLQIRSPLSIERISETQQQNFNSMLNNMNRFTTAVIQPERQITSVTQPQANRFIELNLNKVITTQSQTERYIQPQATRLIETLITPQALRIPQMTRITPPSPTNVTPPTIPPPFIIPNVLGKPSRTRKKERRPARFTLKPSRSTKAYVPDIISQWISQNRYGKVTFPTQREQARFSARNAGYVPTKEMIQRGAAKEKYPRFTGFGQQFSAAAGKFRVGASNKHIKTGSHKNPLTGLFRKK